jgi:calcineurin-like phosphoesterase family protein
MLKINSSDNSGFKVWITSDTHYNHINICRGTTNWRLPNGEVPEKTTRAFETLEDMNNAIVNNINNIVGEDDILIHCGDFSFGGFDKIGEFRERIICKKLHLVLGNHDNHIERNKNGIRSIFASVQNYLAVDYNHQKLVLCHYPICSWDDMRKGSYHLFGHLHSSEQSKIMSGRSMDIGMDGNNLTPYEIDYVIRKLSGRPVSFNTLNTDHHLL